MWRAFARKLSSPSFKLMELTTGRPCILFSPSFMTFQSEESIITGTRAISGSTPMRDKNAAISATESSIESSRFTSTIFAPAATCDAAMLIASSIDFSFISLRNLRLPATLHLSPTDMNSPQPSTSRDSSPARIMRGSKAGIWRG